MEQLERNLISAVAEAWNAAAPGLLGEDTTLQVLAMREVAGDQIQSALAVAMTWSSAFAAPCEDGLPGVLIGLLKGDEVPFIERRVKRDADGGLNPGTRSLIAEVFGRAGASLGESAGAAVAFGNVAYIDLSADETRLATVVGDAAWVGTFALAVGDELNTQTLVIYAPHGSLEVARATSQAEVAQTDAAPTPAPAPTPTSAPTPAPSAATRRSSARREETPRNIERLLDVELDVVVRFGQTSAPLRDVVRMGVGTMIELNRAVEEPVELLVNGRPLARGEVVVIDGYYGVRITEIGPAAERAAAIL